MSGGPQVRLRTEWLERNLSGKTVIRADTARPKLREAAAFLEERRIAGCFCEGKHIFIEFDGHIFLHNHLLMRGRWRREPGRLLLSPEDMWLGLYIGEATICAVETVLWDSYRLGGRWQHRVYRRRGQPCEVCGNMVRLTRLAPSRRSVYFCPDCQRRS